MAGGGGRRKAAMASSRAWAWMDVPAWALDRRCSVNGAIGQDAMAERTRLAV